MSELQKKKRCKTKKKQTRTKVTKKPLQSGATAAAPGLTGPSASLLSSQLCKGRDSADHPYPQKLLSSASPAKSEVQRYSESVAFDSNERTDGLLRSKHLHVFKTPASWDKVPKKNKIPSACFAHQKVIQN